MGTEHNDNVGFGNSVYRNYNKRRWIETEEIYSQDISK